MKLLLHLVLGTLAVLVAAYLIPGVHIDGYFAALVVALVLGILNTFLRPVLIILTFPITIVTLGLFTLVINTLMVLIADRLVPGFRVDGLWAAFLFGIIISIIHSFIRHKK